MLPSASSLYGEGEAFVFLQDNAPCHKGDTIPRALSRRGPAVACTEPRLESHKKCVGCPLHQGREKQAM